jgi:hypothetical protein
MSYFSNFSDSLRFTSEEHKREILGDYTPSVFGTQSRRPTTIKILTPQEKEAQEAIQAYKKREGSDSVTLADFFNQQMKELSIKDQATIDGIKEYSTDEMLRTVRKLKISLGQQFNWDVHAQYKMVTDVLIERHRLNKDEVEKFQQVKRLEKDLVTLVAQFQDTYATDEERIQILNTQAFQRNESNRSERNRSIVSAYQNNTPHSYQMALQTISNNVHNNVVETDARRATTQRRMNAYDSLQLNKLTTIDAKQELDRIKLRISEKDELCELLAGHSKGRTAIKYFKFTDQIKSFYHYSAQIFNSDNSKKRIICTNHNYNAIVMLKQRFPKLFEDWYSLINQQLGITFDRDALEHRLRNGDTQVREWIINAMNEREADGLIYLLPDIRNLELVHNSEIVLFEEGLEINNYHELAEVKRMDEFIKKRVSQFSIANELELISGFMDLKIRRN